MSTSIFINLEDLKSKNLFKVEKVPGYNCFDQETLFTQMMLSSTGQFLYPIDNNESIVFASVREEGERELIHFLEERNIRFGIEEMP